MTKVTVRLPGRDYQVRIGPDIHLQLKQQVRQFLKNERLFVFYDAQFYALHGPRLRSRLGVPVARLSEMVLPVGEKTKSLPVLRRVYDLLLDEKVSRSDLILACGGGVTTDLVGYAAATTLRGIRWAAVPTTLLGMVDAAIGGKTAINHRRGKNLVGNFWQPAFVHCDVRFLQTLPPRQMLAGFGELVKYGGLIGAGMIEKLDATLAHCHFYDERNLKILVKPAAQYKAEMVSRDERDNGVRAFLNFGHTMGHAIEKALGYGRLLHGEAVILGVLGALEVGNLCGISNKGALAAYRETVEKFVRLLPRRRIRSDLVMDAMALDKKRRGADLNYVILKRPGKPTVVTNIDRRLIGKALDRMLACYRIHGGTDDHLLGR